MDCKNPAGGVGTEQAGIDADKHRLKQRVLPGRNPSSAQHIRQNVGPQLPLWVEIQWREAGGSERSAGQFITRRGQQDNTQHNLSTS